VILGGQRLQIAMTCVAKQIVYVVFTAAIFLSGCNVDQKAKGKFFSEKLACPTPAVDEFQPWGRSGVQHICKIKHGAFVAWENGYVHIRGQYENGKEVGLWRWYDSNGKVVREMNYSQQKK